MPINLNEAEQQKERVTGPIPAKSLVKVKLEIRQPKAGSEDPDDQAVKVFSTGLKGLDLEFTVLSGQFEGKRIWENWFLPPGMQDGNLTKGQTGACNGSFAKMRAVIEAARNLDPNDPAANRNINKWFDLHGLEIPVKIGINKPKPGDEFINNTIAKILTPNMEHFKEVMAGGEVISNEKIPELKSSPAPHDPGAADNNAAPDDPDDGGPFAGPSNTPSWAQ